MNRLVVAVLLLALLGAPVITGCGDSPPQTPSTPPAPAPDQEEVTAKVPSTAKGPAPDQSEDTSEAVKEDEFVPPQDWCGSGHGEWPRSYGGELSRRATIPRLLKRLEDKDSDIVRAATVELGRRNAKEAVPALVRLLETHDDALVRLDATSALGQMLSADVLPNLIEALGDKNGLVRLAAWGILRGEARTLFPEADDEYGSDRKRLEIRRSLLEAIQEDVQRKWRTWWRDNEKIVRRKMAWPR